MVIPLETGALTSALQQLDVQPEVIDKVVSILTSTSDDIDAGTFASNADLAPAEFGHRDTAAELGLHHGKAHQVMQATIDGIAQDLAAFAASAKKAVTYLNSADEGSAADLQQARQAVEQMHQVVAHSQGDRGYDHARNTQDDAPAAGEGS